MNFVDSVALLDLKSIMEDLENPKKSSGWDSIIINRAKPVTYRVFKYYGDIRFCLHRIEPCKFEESFYHPHAWPATFRIFSGKYFQNIGLSSDLTSEMEHIMTMECTPHFTYAMCDPRLFHKITPLETVYSIMINGPDYEKKHKYVRTTTGKNLSKMTDGNKHSLMLQFSELLVS